MSKPETKTVLGRVFTLYTNQHIWRAVTSDSLWLELNPPWPRFGIYGWGAELYNPEKDKLIASGEGPTEADAILALQATLRKIAELEVVE